MIISQNYMIKSQLLHDRITKLHDHITKLWSQNYTIISYNYMIMSQNYMIISQYYIIISQYYMIISQYYMVISHYYLIISQYYMSYHHSMPWNHEITEPNQSPRTPSVLSSHSQATVSHPRANIRLWVRNRHIKSAIKDKIPGKTQTLVKDNGKSFVEKLRMLSSYTFCRRILQKPS